MSQSDNLGDRLLSAERALEDFHVRRERGEPFDFESLVRAHPHLEAELREMHALAGAVDGAFEDGRERYTAEQASIAAILKQIGGGADAGTRYTLEGEVGKGGMGVVYRVRDTKLDRPLAMKVILGQADVVRTGKTPPIPARQLARFVNEAKITGQLDHPGIVPVHEVGVDQEGRAYFTMKLVKGITLAEVFERRAADDPEWSMPRVLGVIQRVCEAMAFAHDRGVIHRDLKPANVMVGDFGEVYVMDWGLARSQGETDEVSAHPADQATNAAIDEQLSDELSLTRDGAVIGTPAYMSSEQARGDISSIGPHSDVYAIGAMLYQLIVGRPPYVKQGEKVSGSELLMRVVTSRPARIESKSTPPELIAICEKAMSYERDGRYPNVRELAADLHRFLGGRTVNALKTGPWVELKKWVRRNRSLASAFGGTILVLTAAAIHSTVKTREAERAQIRESEARRVADQDADAARAAQAEARQKTDDLLSLSALQTLQNLTKEADALWPASPAMLPEYDRWLAKAAVLIDGRAEDRIRGLSRKPGLSEHLAKLDEIRRRAIPPTHEESERYDASLASISLETSRRQLTWMCRMLGEEPWPLEAESTLAMETLPVDKTACDEFLQKLVDPRERTVGDEVRTLLWARRALAVSSDADRPARRDILAWALLWAGQLEAALEEERSVLEEAPEGQEFRYVIGFSRLASEAEKWGIDHRAERVRERNDLALVVARLERNQAMCRVWNFESEDDKWWEGQLSNLVSSLEAFRDPTSGLYSEGISSEHGWGVLKRRAFAASVQELTITGDEAAQLWQHACASIADETQCPAYKGLHIKPQLGLIPIGMDPCSRLWEFAHLQTGNPAVRRQDQNLLRTEETGLVFVLIPGGCFWMGAQPHSVSSPNFDPWSTAGDSVNEVELSPYFISKYEMTVNQWKLLTGDISPSGAASTRLPISIGVGDRPFEYATWERAQEVLGRVGLLLPTEAQWERAARGGRDTPWWTGEDVSSLQGAENLADSTFIHFGLDANVKLGLTFPDDGLEDGFVGTAPVGTFMANPFGLYDVHGNVDELCRDWFDSTSAPLRPGDGERLAVVHLGHVVRGGSRSVNPRLARSEYRQPYILGDLKVAGVRPVRSVDW